MVEYKVYDSIYQVYGSIETFMQIYIDDMQVYSCIYNPRALLRRSRRSAVNPVNSHHIPKMTMLILSICKYIKVYVVI
jgi:hypothetical protein